MGVERAAAWIHGLGPVQKTNPFVGNREEDRRDALPGVETDGERQCRELPRSRLATSGKRHRRIKTRIQDTKMDEGCFASTRSSTSAQAKYPAAEPSHCPSSRQSNVRRPYFTGSTKISTSSLFVPPGMSSVPSVCAFPGVTVNAFSSTA
jgi:hypothetical protein